jgi:four helix bundle protein
MMNGGAGRPRDIGDRTKAFALRVIRLYVALPKTTEAEVLGKQVLRSETSVGAHIREGRRARSDAEMISKIEGSLQELDETTYWMELLSESGIVEDTFLRLLLDEAEEIAAILVTSIRTLKSRKERS